MHSGRLSLTNFSYDSRRDVTAECSLKPQCASPPGIARQDINFLQDDYISLNVQRTWCNESENLMLIQLISVHSLPTLPKRRWKMGFCTQHRATDCAALIYSVVGPTFWVGEWSRESRKLTCVAWQCRGLRSQRDNVKDSECSTGATALATWVALTSLCATHTEGALKLCFNDESEL